MKLPIDVNANGAYVELRHIEKGGIGLLRPDEARMLAWDLMRAARAADDLPDDAPLVLCVLGRCTCPRVAIVSLTCPCECHK